MERGVEGARRAARAAVLAAAGKKFGFSCSPGRCVLRRLVIAVEHIVGDLVEAACFGAEFFESIFRGRGEFACFIARGLEAENRRVGGLSDCLILACGFAEHFARLGGVEDVIDDLKSQPEVPPESGEGFELVAVGTAKHRAEAERAGEKGGGLALVDVPELVVGEVAAFAFQVEHLPGDDILPTGSYGEFPDEVAGRVGIFVREVAEKLERECMEGISSEHSNRFTVDLMAGGLSTAEVVVVHAREVIMDEREGMKHLESTGSWKSRISCLAESLGGDQTEDRPEPFAAGEDAVAHGFVQVRGWRLRCGKQGVEGVIDACAVVSNVSLEVHGRRLRKSA